MRKSLCLPLRRVVISWIPCQKLFQCPRRFHGTNLPTVDNSISTSLGVLSKEIPLPRDSAREKLEEQIRGLSEEDQKLIRTALENPEQQPKSKMGGDGIGTKSADMVAAFTCGRCEFRMVKKFSKHAYTKGIVIVQCPSCEVKHLLADNLGWFVDEARNIEDMLKEKGESFVRIGNDFQLEPSEDNKSSGP